MAAAHLDREVAGRVVEGEVAVFADADEGDVDLGPGADHRVQASHLRRGFRHLVPHTAACSNADGGGADMRGHASVRMWEERRGGTSSEFPAAIDSATPHTRIGPGTHPPIQAGRQAVVRAPRSRT
jgi:hypothetical protein